MASMCQPDEWELVRLDSSRLGAKLSDGRIIDLQAAHVAFKGTMSPHLRDAISFRLSASYGAGVATELVRWALAGNHPVVAA